METSRRALLTSSLAGLVAAGVAASTASEAAAPDAGASKLTALPATHDPVLHTVRRLTFGATPELLKHVRGVGVKAWLDEQLGGGLDLQGTVHSVGVGSLPLPTVVMADIDAYASRNASQDLQLATIARHLFGARQIEELMVEFWSNHLSININNEAVGGYKVADDREVIRPHALGKFTDLLRASVQSPAMLRYLNNDSSHGRKPNENYARELLELHTVGVHGGYKQADVFNAALALTGMTVDGTTGEFVFDKSRHATGPVKVMGWHAANATRAGGKDVALSLISYLAHHPATAKRIATKLVRRLVSDNPPAGLVSSAAKVFTSSGTAIVPVLRHILSSAEFARSVGAKSQRPYEWFTASVRALGIEALPSTATPGYPILDATRKLQQAPFEWVPPDGYPDVTTAWASTASMLTRWNIAQALVSGGIGGLQPVDADKLIGSPYPATAGELVDRLATTLLGVAPRAALKAGVLHGVEQKARNHLTTAQAQSVALPMAALLLSSPEAQVR